MHRRLAVAACLTLVALAVPSAAAANDPPVCNDTFYETERNTPVAVAGGCSDPDGPASLTYSLVQNTGPFPGTLTNLDPAGSATYVPAPNYVGPDSFQFTASDGLATSAPATAHITVVDGDGENAAPVCPSPTYFVPVGSSTVLTGNCADADGDNLTYSLDSSPDQNVGTLALVPPASVVFTAVAEGSTSLTYHAFDGQLSSNTASVFLEVVPTGGTEQSTGTEATPEDPAQASITTTETGSVVVTQIGAEGTTADGLLLLPFQFNIEAPSGEDPLTLRFTLDASAIPAGHDENTIVVLRDGAPIAECTGDGLGPDPCVSNRASVGDGDVELTVLSSHASRWNFAVPPVQPKAGKGCGDKNHAHAREGACRKPAK
jgi:hypothetical protein